MTRTYESTLHPGFLPPGTQVGPWRVVAQAGRGTQGAVYRAVRVDSELPGPVALKLALLPRNPRFAREVELLSRVEHPSIPRLYEHGEWQHPSGPLYPYLTIEWVDGAPLYEWAKQDVPTLEQVCRVLAQLARALQALRAAGGVHRDVKGDNVLVRRGNERAVLLDAGVCTYAGAEVLTPQATLPGTPAYRSPEAALFAIRNVLDRSGHYEAGSGDDVYALGVTAYRMLTGEYPPPPEPFPDESGTWQMQSTVPTAPHVLNRRVDPRLSGLVLRMLAVHPEERITAEKAAETLEQLAASALSSPPDPKSSHFEHTGHGAFRRRWQWVASLTAGLAFVAWVGWSTFNKSQERPASARAGVASAENGSATGLGDEVSAAPKAKTSESSAPELLAEEALPEPQPGQTRPAANGRCPRKGQVALNGGCWRPSNLERAVCEEEVRGYMFKGTCYLPIFLPGRQPASNPPGTP
jgi:serine/threonine protein kinase